MSLCPDHFYDQPPRVGERSCFQPVALESRRSTAVSEQPLPCLLADGNGHTDEDAMSFTVLVLREGMPLGMAMRS